MLGLADRTVPSPVNVTLVTVPVLTLVVYPWPLTQAVVAIEVELSDPETVGAVGVPVNAGDTAITTAPEPVGAPPGN